MKNVLVASQFLPAIPAGGLTALTKGQLVCLRANGTVATNTEFESEEFLQFVVGLGNGKIKHGAYLNGLNCKVVKTAYTAEGFRAYAMTLTATVGEAYKGMESALTISLPPLNISKGYPNKTYTALAIVQGGAQTAIQHIADLKADLDKQVIAINKEYGVGAITVALAGSVLTITGKVGLDFKVSTDGQTTNTVVVTGAGAYGNGSSKEVSSLEKESAVADMGYNPNFKIGVNPYGNIFNTIDGKTYTSFVLTTEAERTHPFMSDTKGRVIEQFIAIDSTATSITDLETLLGL